MKIKKEIIENFMKSKQLLENKSKNGSDLIMGTAEYTEFLEKIISDLRAVKGSLKTRSRIGKENRKEADRIQAAVNALKYLSGKSFRILNNSLVNEEKSQSLSRSDIKNFIKSLETE